MSQNNVLTAFPYCGGQLIIPAATNTTNSDPPIGAYYGCLGTSTQNLTWFYIKFSSAGNFGFSVSPTANLDVAVWGSFSSLNDAYNSGLTNSKLIDCYIGNLNFSISVTNSDLNKFFIILVKNTANTPANITISQNYSTANISCVPLEIDTNSPICEGNSLILQPNTIIPNANYQWTGPNGFNSTGQVITIPNYYPYGSYTYNCYYTLGTYSSSTIQKIIIVKPKPITSNIYHY